VYWSAKIVEDKTEKVADNHSVASSKGREIIVKTEKSQRGFAPHQPRRKREEGS